MDGFIYSNRILDFFPHAEGYVNVIPEEDYYSFQYVYQYKDHLGNVRLSYSDANLDGTIQTTGIDSEIIEEHNYYLFGLQHKGYNNVVIGQENNYFNYNGKELNLELGLNLLYYGWRNYDSSLGRWINMDNMAEKYVSNSPYHYAGNNPILNFDIDGNEFTEGAWEWVNKLLGEIHKRLSSNYESIRSAEETIASGKFGLFQSEKSLTKKINRLKDESANLNLVSSEIFDLSGSDQVYDVVNDSGGTNRDLFGNSTTTNTTSFNVNTGNVEISISSGTDLSLFAHELKHAHQFEKGEASFGAKGGSGFSFLLDKQDEIAGYKREGLFGGNSGNISNISNLPSQYSSLPSGPVSIHSLSPAVSNLVRTGNNIQLQSLANQRNQAFRVNNKTFIPKQKK